MTTKDDMTLPLYRETDCDLSRLRDKTVAVIGYGAQGHAHAQNLKDSGLRVVVGLRDQSPSCAAAREAGLETDSIERAAAQADVVMMLIPDEQQPAVYRTQIEPHIKRGAALGFAHGLCVHFGFIRPRDDLDVFMVAPKGPGYALRAEYKSGAGLPALMAVAQESPLHPPGHAKQVALAYGAGIGCARVGLLETSFKDECETDLFGEQSVLCGGISSLLLAGYETLVEAGYPPEIAYFECVHEAKLVVDLVYAKGLARMREHISNTAEYGDYTRGARIVNTQTRAEMKKILSEIQSGAFAREFMGGNQEGLAHLPDMRAERAAHPIEKTGARLRALMPWLNDKKK